MEASNKRQSGQIVDPVHVGCLTRSYNVPWKKETQQFLWLSL